MKINNNKPVEQNTKEISVPVKTRESMFKDIDSILVNNNAKPVNLNGKVKSIKDIANKINDYNKATKVIRCIEITIVSSLVAASVLFAGIMTASAATSIITCVVGACTGVGLPIGITLGFVFLGLEILAGIISIGLAVKALTSTLVFDLVIKIIDNKMTEMKGSYSQQKQELKEACDTAIGHIRGELTNDFIVDEAEEKGPEVREGLSKLIDELNKIKKNCE